MNPVGTNPVAPVGVPVGVPVGTPVAPPVGTPVGAPVGMPVGAPVGTPVAPPVGAPVQAFGEQNEMMNANPSASVGTIQPQNKVVVVGYITGQRNYVKTHDIPFKEAGQLYAKCVEEELAKPKEQQITEMPLRGTNGKEVQGEKAGTVKFDPKDKFSQSRLRSLFPDAVEKLKAENYKRVVLSESKAESFVVRSLLDVSGDTRSLHVFREALDSAASLKNYETRIFTLKRKNLIEYMVTTSVDHVPVVDWAALEPLVQANDTKEIDKAITNSIGRILVDVKEADPSNPDSEDKFDLAYTRIKERTGIYNQVKTVKELDIPYAINKDKTTGSGVITAEDLAQGKVKNADQVKKLFGEDYDFSQLGTLEESAGTDTAAKEELKKKQIVQWSDQKGDLGYLFFALGLLKEDVDSMRSPSSSSKSSTKTYKQLLTNHKKALSMYQSPSRGNK